MDLHKCASSMYDFIFIQIGDNFGKNCRLIINLTLKTDPTIRHFFKLFHLGNKKCQEVAEGQIEYRIQSNEEIKLDFFGIRKATKEQAMKFIAESLPLKDADSILKKNSSTVILNIVLFDFQNNQIGILKQELNVGNPSTDEIIINRFVPKTLYDDGELTFVLKNKIKDENDSPKLEVVGQNNNYQKMLKMKSQPAKNVVVFHIQIPEIKSDSFTARLHHKDSLSEIVTFFIRPQLTDERKRKSSAMEESPSLKMLRNEPIQIMNDLSIIHPCRDNDRKRMVNENLTKKLLREIARVGHDFAFGRDLTDKMKEIMNRIPVVCILQDDVGDTPLNNAILQNQEERASCLVDIIYRYFPKEINLENTSGHTPLILSPACDVSVEFVKKLIYCGANLSAIDCEGNSAFNYAIRYKRSDIFIYLIHEGISQNYLVELNDILISLIKDTINQDFFNGFQILAQYFDCLLCFDMVAPYLEYHELKTYEEFTNRITVDKYLTPIVENEQIDLDLIFLDSPNISNQ